MLFGVSYYRLVKHDWTKFLPSEWVAYVEYFYGLSQDKTGFDRAWLHHIHFNDHHWQHWILNNDDGSTNVLAMSEVSAREMVADWYGAGYAINGRDDLVQWFKANKDKMVVESSTLDFVEELISAYETRWWR